ncbi:MAG: WYL domain-containing protein [Bacteroidales bacterium]|jgi:predicted DNA-binding transcriptional regulator YafY|nr:WYL domain-containing protein [Bacteroidales bacterium]
MATNKHATIRYHALDQCFSNPGRKYYIEDLIEACNNALYEYTGTLDGIKRRQIFDDIKFMESEQGWSIPLDKVREGKRVYYRYSDKNFSIKKQAINESEANQLKETLSILNRFKGMPQFDWMEEMLVRLESTFNLKTTINPIIDFEQNPYLKGLNFFSELFNAIHYRKVLNVCYQSFKQENPIEICLHPYFLKQYNNRWFLFGLNETKNSISNLALDRIIEVNEVNKQFIENEIIDFEEYFDDVVGVTVTENQKPIKILLQISNELFPYIESKPIHGSQKIKERTSESVIIELTLQLNYEFISLVFSYGEEVTVIEPEELKTIIKTKAEKVFKNYI